MTIKHVSCLHFEYPKSNSVLRNERGFVYHLRGPQSRADDAHDNAALMNKFRITAASHIKAAKDVYEISIPDELDQLSTHSPAWNDLANAI
eukprot:9492152-Pyramimonas_sp.AAC.1